jgi:nucleoside-diphosphate-sugar epimerase
MTRVLVTGATGLLGRRVVEVLRTRDCTVTTLARHGAELEADLADANDAERVLATWRWDACVHLAAPVTSGEETLATGLVTTRVHARIALNLRRLARGRIVHASSMAVYGLPRTTPVSEDHALAPTHLYGLGKALAEDVWLSDLAVHAIVVRFGGLFGEQRRNGAVFQFSLAARRGAPLRVATPTPTPWEVLHVEDAAEGLVRAALNANVPRGPLNLGYGEPVELVAIARLIAALGGKGSTVDSLPGVVHPLFQLDIDRARSVLDWAPPSLTSRLVALQQVIEP